MNTVILFVIIFIGIILAWWVIFHCKGGILWRTIALAFIATLYSLFIEQGGGWIGCDGRGFPLPYIAKGCENKIIVFIIDWLAWMIPTGFIVTIKEGVKETLGKK